MYSLFQSEPGFENIKLQNIGSPNGCIDLEGEEDLLERKTRRRSSIAPSKLASNVDKVNYYIRFNFNFEHSNLICSDEIIFHF